MSPGKEYVRGRTAAAWGLAASLLLSGACSSDDDPPATAPEEEFEADPTLVAVHEWLDDEGGLSIEAAQRIFAAAVGPLPGVEPVDFDVPAGSGVAGMAIRRLAVALDELPPEVAAAVTAIVEPQGEEEAEVPRGGDLPTTDELAAELAEIRTDFDSRTGHTLGLRVRVRTVPDASTGGDAVTTPSADNTVCRIALPRGLFGDDDASVRSTLAHELWHCYQTDANPSGYDSAPEWIAEGQAEWAGEAYVGGSPSSAGRWNTWLLTPDDSLFRRSYDAIGIYAVAEAQGADPWQTMLPMLGQGNQAAVEALFGGAAVDGVGAAAMALVRAPDVGAEWEHTGPGITGAQGAPILAVSEDDVAETSQSVGRFATLPVVLAIRAGDVLTVTATGGAVATAGFIDSGTFPLGAGGTAQFCLRDEGCECPDGSNPGGGEPLPEINPGEGAVGIGAVDAGELRVRAEISTIEEACERTLVGTWVTDVGTVLDMLTGGSSGLDCSGPYTVTFGADGTLTVSINGRCTVEDSTGTFRGGVTGTYTDNGTEFTAANITTTVGGEAVIEINGREISVPFLESLTQALATPTPYTIEGDVLTFTYTAPDGNAFTFQFTRSG